MAADPLRYFRVEARELVDLISAGVLELDQQPGPEPVARLLRFAHTLKGAARVVRQEAIADRAHAFEEVLVTHRADTGPLPGDEMRELLRLNDEIERRVAALEPAAGGPAAPAGPAPAAPAQAVGAAAPPHAAAAAAPPHAAAAGAPPHAAAAGAPPHAAAASAPPHAAAAGAPPPPRAAAGHDAELLDAIGEAHARLAALRGDSRSLDRLHGAAETLADRLRTDRPGAAESARTAAVRLCTDLRSAARRLTDLVEQAERELDEVRGRAERLRLVAASSIFTALHRAVRDAADAEGKRVRFEGHGGDLRMDPQVLTLVAGALQHVVRNAVSHGIEAAADRAAAGKPAEGRVSVQVERRGRFAAFRCTDDGGGFDLAAIRRRAQTGGLLAPGGGEPDEEALLDLLLRGGISTSAAVTTVSGRGIGLDVARDVADQLGGEVTVRTEAGRGATVELVVPLALLSLRGLVVEAAGTVATVPLDAVHSCLRLGPEQAAAAAATGRLAHEGRAVPFVSLARALYAGSAPDAAAPAVAVLMVSGAEVIAVGVEKLTGTTTLVLRPLPELAPAAQVIGGVSVDLDGNPRIVLDAPGLVAEAARHGGTGEPVPAGPDRPLPILVVDDSLTTRMLERGILESAGYEVDLAASGEEGLRKARARRYSLFLTDIDMPGVDGFTFVAETRADPDLRHVPAILVSSRAGADDRRRGADVGAAAYVVKGEFDQEELLGHIRRLVGGETGRATGTGGAPPAEARHGGPEGGTA